MRKNIFFLFFIILILITSLISGCGHSNVNLQKTADSGSVHSEGDKKDSTTTENKSINVTMNETANTADFSLTQDNYIFDQAEKTKCELNLFPTENSEEYSQTQESDYLSSVQSPLSTFSIDVDTASYGHMRRYLNHDQMLPPPEVIRIEELINYFSYDYTTPTQEPFSVYSELGQCPWNSDHYLAMISLKGKDIIPKERPASNLVFLLDVSGSMNDPLKLPLLKSAFHLLTEQLSVKDTISIVVYAGASGVVLQGAEGSDKDRIMDAIDQLSAGGSTAGGEGIELSYSLAKKYFIEGGNNRVILATDGDFNVGISTEEGLIELIKDKRKEGIFLSVLGFGTGNIKDNNMEALADHGNGNYAYIDSISEAKKVLVNEMASTLFTIAKDVKIQVEFNPNKVASYRLIGYDNRRLADEDFDNDAKDAGDIGSGHTVTAFYELIPTEGTPAPSQLRYQENRQLTEKANSSEWYHIKLRYKEPDENISQLIEKIVDDEAFREKNTSNFNFASAVAESGLLLKDSQFKGDASWNQVIKRARDNKGSDEMGYRSEYIQLMELAKYFMNNSDSTNKHTSLD